MSKQTVLSLLVISTLILATRCNPASAPTPPRSPTPISPKSTATPGLSRAPVRPTRTAAPTLPSRTGIVERDVTYCTADGTVLKMDLFFPAPSDKLTPVAVNVHGGSWSGGDKSSSEGVLEISELASRGYLVAAINYRLAPEYKFPTQIEDVKCAIRHLRANASTYRLDPNRIGAWGCSAGGHLVSLLALTDYRTDFDGTGAYAEQSSRVQAAVPMSAPADMTQYDITKRAEMLSRVFGVTTSINPLLVRASPVTYITKNAPPFLIFAGQNDTIVPPAQGQVLYDRLTAAGVPATLVIVQNAGHCFPPTPMPISPSREEISKMIADFFDREM